MGDLQLIPMSLGCTLLLLLFQKELFIFSVLVMTVNLYSQEMTVKTESIPKLNLNQLLLRVDSTGLDGPLALLA